MRDEKEDIQNKVWIAEAACTSIHHISLTRPDRSHGKISATKFSNGNCLLWK